MSPAATINGSSKIATAATGMAAAGWKTTGLSVLEGALLRSPCGFPYLFLVAFEAGSILRAFVLLLIYPLLLVASKIIADSRLLDRGLVLIAVAGLRASAVESVARGVLPRFFLEDLRWDCYTRFVSCQRRCVVSTRLPRQLIEPFLRDFLEVKQVLGPDLEVSSRGIYTGMIARPAIATAVGVAADLGMCCSDDRELVRLCKEEYVVEANPNARAVPRKHYLKPLVFHDGRLAVRPTPAMALTIFLWLPIGIALAIPRSLILVLCPNIPFILASEAFLGIVMRYTGTPPPSKVLSSPAGTSREGTLFVCSHRTLLDPVMLSGPVMRRVTAVTYSISWLSELLAPIRTVRLMRCRSHDARIISSHLRRGDLIICPEGTTCREPYLLRFSKLFVEIADTIVPVAINCEVQLFHGTSVRGWKAMDPFFFALNPRPRYDINFLERVSLVELVDRGATSFEIANMIQHRIARALGFQCTGYTRRDKYRMLAEHGGGGGGARSASGGGAAAARKTAGGGAFESPKPASEDSKEDS